MEMLVQQQQAGGRYLLAFTLVGIAVYCGAVAAADDLAGSRQPGHKGIWFTLGQRSEYGDKYSGGLGTYTAKHKPLAIYSPNANKTFFVFGGTTAENERHLLCMIGCFDHASEAFENPVVVHDKQGVDDPHDNPSLLIDADGYLWVFVSGRGTRRPGFKYQSLQPFSIDGFEQVSQEEMTYPQPWFVPGFGFFHFFTKYSGVRELYFETSTDGRRWTNDRKLASVKSPAMTRSGHYQVSGIHADSQGSAAKLGTFFNWHPNGNVDQRTNLYYLESSDFGESWTNAAGLELELPIERVDSPSRVVDLYGQETNVYLKDIGFDGDGNPVCLYVTSGGHEPGPRNDPRRWHVTRWDGTGWRTSEITTSDHNYDMGSLWIEDGRWTVIAPTRDGPQRYGAGGELVRWESTDQGRSWRDVKSITSDSPRNHNYVRRVVNGVDPFRYFWADGNPDRFSRSQLFIGDASETRPVPYHQ